MDQHGRYIIPPNYSPKGMLMGKDIRNYIEMTIIAFILGGIIIFIPMPIDIKLYAGVILLLPAMVLSYFGINGMSLFTFVLLFFKYRQSPKEYGRPSPEDRIKRRKMMLKKEKKNLANKRRQDIIEKRVNRELFKTKEKMERFHNKRKRGDVSSELTKNSFTDNFSNEYKNRPESRNGHLKKH